MPRDPPKTPSTAWGVPTHPGEGQVHLQLGDAAADAGADPVAEGNGAEGVVGGAVAPQPALGEEALGLGEVGLVVGHGVVRQDEEGLRGEKGVNALRGTAGSPPERPQLTFLGKR